MVNPKSPKLDAAWEFVKFWLTEGSTPMLAGGKLPTLDNVTDDQVVTGMLGKEPEKYFDVESFHRVPGRAVLRAIFCLPYIVNVVAIGVTWLMLMNPKAGLVNQVLDVFGIQPGWFASSHWALPALIVMAVWGGVGYCSLIYLSALQDAPRQLYEAADIDGASAWAKFRVITCRRCCRQRSSCWSR